MKYTSKNSIVVKLFLRSILSLIALTSMTCVSNTMGNNKNHQSIMIPDSLKVFRISVDSLLLNWQRDFYYQFNVNRVAAAWKYDSKGCLQLRNYIMAEYLVDKLEMIKILFREDIVRLLGYPNRIMEGKLYDIKENGAVVHYLYYYGPDCEENLQSEKLIGCWLDVTFSSANEKVVDAGWVCFD